METIQIRCLQIAFNTLARNARSILVISISLCFYIRFYVQVMLQLSIQQIEPDPFTNCLQWPKKEQNASLIVVLLSINLFDSLMLA